MRSRRPDVTYLSFGYHGDRSPGLIPEPHRDELVSIGARILTAWYASSVLAREEVDLHDGVDAETLIVQTLRQGLATRDAHAHVGVAGIAFMLHAPSGWECGLVGSPPALRPAIVAAVPPGARLMLDRGGDTRVEWGELSIETNWQDAKSELGREAIKQWRAERKRASANW